LLAWPAGLLSLFTTDWIAGYFKETQLPSVSQTIDWVRLPQRFAVRLRVVGRLPVPLRIGQTVYVAMTAMVERTEAPKRPLVTVEHGLTKSGE
jgi:hypothetical protein